MKILMVPTSHDQLGNTVRQTGFGLKEFRGPVLCLPVCSDLLEKSNSRHGPVHAGHARPAGTISDRETRRHEIGEFRYDILLGRPWSNVGPRR